MKISYSDEAIDALNYTEWEPQMMEIMNPKDPSERFNWQLRPTYKDGYLLKGDRILLDIFQQNFYSRPFYFSQGSDSSYNLFLGPYLKTEGLVERVTDKKSNELADGFKPSVNLAAYNLDKIKTEDLLKSPDAVSLVNFFRWAYYNNIIWLYIYGDYKKAAELIAEMNAKFPKDKLPYYSNRTESYFNRLFDAVAQKNQ